MTPWGAPRASSTLGVCTTRGLLICKRSLELISSLHLPRRRGVFFFFLRNEKKNEAPAGGTWSDYSGILDTNTYRDQASKSDIPCRARPSIRPVKSLKASELQLCTACLFCPFQIPRGEMIFFLLPKHRGKPFNLYISLGRGKF